MVVNKKESLVASVTNCFQLRYHRSPLRVFSPGRINLIGEHTDYNMGYVLPAAIDLGIAVAIGLSDKPYGEIFAMDEDSVCVFCLDTITVASKGAWQNYILGVVAQLQAAGYKIKPFNLCFSGTVPQGSGMSSSAALENAVVFALNELFGLALSKMQMVAIAQAAEHEFVGVQCGVMDMYASMFGEENTALLLHCKSMEVEAVPLQLEDYRLVLVNSKVQHSLADSAYNQRRETCESVAKHIGVEVLSDASLPLLHAYRNELEDADYQKARYVLEENQRVVAAASALRAKDLPLFGVLLTVSHLGLRDLYKVSCKEIDFLVDHANLQEEVLGSRMMGGGFGGSTINLLHKDAIAAFETELLTTYKKKFGLDAEVYQVAIGEGTHIIEEVAN